jgi:hybrid cluster-associated redox disulfide protein
MAEITKDMTIAQVLRLKPETGEVFNKLGMFCLGCPTATSETIEQAAEVHGLTVEQLIRMLNEA